MQKPRANLRAFKTSPTKRVYTRAACGQSTAFLSAALPPDQMRGRLCVRVWLCLCVWRCVIISCVQNISKSYERILMKFFAEVGVTQEPIDKILVVIR